MSDVSEVDVMDPDLVKVSPYKDPVTIDEDDYEAVRQLQVNAEALPKVRQEIGRLYGVISNLNEKAKETEESLRDERLRLASKYGLDKHPGQWLVDFDKKEFVMAAQDAPVVP